LNNNSNRATMLLMKTK